MLFLDNVTGHHQRPASIPRGPCGVPMLMAPGVSLPEGFSSYTAPQAGSAKVLTPQDQCTIKGRAQQKVNQIHLRSVVPPDVCSTACS